jgi:hypothetical protein
VQYHCLQLTVRYNKPSNASTDPLTLCKAYHRLSQLLLVGLAATDYTLCILE